MFAPSVGSFRVLLRFTVQIFMQKCLMNVSWPLISQSERFHGNGTICTIPFFSQGFLENSQIWDFKILKKFLRISRRIYFQNYVGKHSWKLHFWIDIFHFWLCKIHCIAKKFQKKSPAALFKLGKHSYLLLKYKSVYIYITNRREAAKFFGHLKRQFFFSRISWEFFLRILKI